MEESEAAVLRRWRIYAPWLGWAAEACLTADRLILRDRETGACSTLHLADLVEVVGGPHGVRLRVRERGCWVDFGGIGFDGWYDVGCFPPEGGTDLLAALTTALASYRGSQVAPDPFLARVRRARSVRQ